MASLTEPSAKSVAAGMVFLDASGSVTAFPIQWVVKPTTPIITSDKGSRQAVYGLIPNLADGTEYIVTVVAKGKDENGDPTAMPCTVRFVTPAAAPVTPVNPTPQPQPTPTPGPSPTPNPPAPVTPTVAAPKWALLVWDNSNDEPSTAKLRGSPVNAALAPLGCTWSVETTAQAAKANRENQLKGETVPVVLFLDGAGQKVGSLPIAGPSGDGLMPGTTADDVAAKVQALKGGR